MMKQALRTCVWWTLLLLLALGGVWAQQQPRPLKLKIQAEERGEVCPFLYASEEYEIEYYEEGTKARKRRQKYRLILALFVRNPTKSITSPSRQRRLFSSFLMDIVICLKYNSGAM